MAASASPPSHHPMTMMAERQDLAQWIHEEARRARRLGESATTAEAQDTHREYVLNFTAIGCALEALASTQQHLQSLQAAVQAEIERLRTLVGEERWTASATENPHLRVRAHVRASAYAFAADRLEALLQEEKPNA